MQSSIYVLIWLAPISKVFSMVNAGLHMKIIISDDCSYVSYMFYCSDYDDILYANYLFQCIWLLYLEQLQSSANKL